MLKVTIKTLNGPKELLNAKHTLLYFTTAEKHETTTILSLKPDIILLNLIKPKIKAGCSSGFLKLSLLRVKHIHDQLLPTFHKR